MNTRIISYLVGLFVLLPGLAFGQTLTSVTVNTGDQNTQEEEARQLQIELLEQQIALLLAQIQAIQKAQGTNSADADQSNESIRQGAIGISNNLVIGSRDASTNGDVSLLQQYLVNVGVYPEAIVSGYYGPLTQRAVNRLLAANSIKVESGEGYSLRINTLLVEKKQIDTSLKPDENKTADRQISMLSLEDLTNQTERHIGRYIDSRFDALLSFDFGETEYGDYVYSLKSILESQIDQETLYHDTTVTQQTMVTLDGAGQLHENIQNIRFNREGTFTQLQDYSLQTAELDDSDLTNRDLNRVKGEWYKLQNDPEDEDEPEVTDYGGSLEYLSVWFGDDEFYDAYDIQESSRQLDSEKTILLDKNIYRYDLVVDTDTVLDQLERELARSAETELAEKYGYGDIKDFRDNVVFDTYYIWLDANNNIYAMSYLMTLENTILDDDIERVQIAAYLQAAPLDDLDVKTPDDYTTSRKSSLDEIIADL